LLKPQNELKFNNFFAAPAAPRKLRNSHDKNPLPVCSEFPARPRRTRRPSLDTAPSASSEHVDHVRGGFVEIATAASPLM
jgi:hypothetical protein